ncbi:hypothetical protein WJX72_010861 [[Myrmecia] bisecta]|uniref:Calcium-dependent protein kinase n=1 Tax=[Myrmecia] bisecta TaxID=41462 RepID=A0AAW1PR32_9CHLO
MAGRVLGKTKNNAKLQEVYTLGAVLGKGAFGTVYLAAEKTTGKQYACKSIAKAKLVCEEDVEDVRREVEILNLVGDHPNVADLYATYEDAAHVHLILQLCKGGELFDRVVSKGTFSEKQAAHYFRTMVLVINHLHQLGVMHRDIKPENFLLMTQEDNAALQLADFGLSTYFKPGQKFKHIVGSAYYVAPEVLRKDYGFEADIWSLGVILYILLSGLPPFWGDTEEDIFKMVLKGDLDFATAPWPEISDAAKDCVRKLLTRDPAKRPTAHDILQHPWLQQQGAAPDRPLDSVVITRMRKFAAMGKLKKAALLVIAKSLSESEISGLGQLFKSIDADSNGTITVDELRAALTKMGNKVNDSELQAIMAAADVDGDGLIDYEEFLAATVNLNKLEREAHCLEAFHHFDKDNSGYITPDEVQQAMLRYNSAGASEVKAMIEEYDTNKDGMIDYTEFVSMIRHNTTELQQASSFFRNLRVPATVAPA